MRLARVGARTESTTRYSFNARRGQFPRTRIGIVRRKICINIRRGFYTLVLIIISLTIAAFGLCRVKHVPCFGIALQFAQDLIFNRQCSPM